MSGSTTTAAWFLAAVVAQAKLRRYVSSEHFSVDGTLLGAWASPTSCKPNDTPPTDPPGPGWNSEVNFRGQRRANETHTSTTDPEARRARKSDATAAKLCYAGHLLMEHRHALIVDMELTTATGYAEREAALEMLGRFPPRTRRRTVAGDKGDDVAGFVADTRVSGFTPPRGADHHPPVQRHRWSHDPPGRASEQPAHP